MTAQVVERWNSFARVRQDLFGCIDVVACGPQGIVGIQATTKANVSARIRKSAALPALRSWLEAGGVFEVWGWHKPTHRWDVVVRPVCLDDCTGGGT